MEWNPKGESEEQLKTLNKVLTGPWKNLMRQSELVLKGSSPYTLEKTVQYLVKKHKRQEVWDNTLEKCRLCGKDVKRVVMERHLTKMCHMREEPCQYCGNVYVVSKMEVAVTLETHTDHTVAHTQIVQTIFASTKQSL